MAAPSHVAFEILHHGAQVGEIDRLGDDEIESSPIVGMCHEPRGVGGDADELVPSSHCGWRRFELRNHPQSVHCREVEIHQSDILAALQQSLERLSAVVHEVDPVPALRQQKLEQVLGYLAVLGHQNRQGCPAVT